MAGMIGSRPAMEKKFFVERHSLDDLRFLISRVSHLVTRLTVRSFRVKNLTPNLGAMEVIANGQRDGVELLLNDEESRRMNVPVQRPLVVLLLWRSTRL